MKDGCFCQQPMPNQVVKQKVEIEFLEEKNTKHTHLYDNRRLELRVMFLLKSGFTSATHTYIHYWEIKPMYFRTHLHLLNILDFGFSVLLKRFRRGIEHDVLPNRCFSYSSVEVWTEHAVKDSNNLLGLEKRRKRAKSHDPLSEQHMFELGTHIRTCHV
ncbi:hypothetical protein BT93_L4844 [Corymbia citriodora subsp. variegata]|uniref:Uncharacterized protein n=1 Tax=Corymbia citriodora subsp. variegata TaxID=360336 RepID=A0A8T0CXJ2_CORYI|nr:hypothetical protein BT93_L4844 [Corymbia citriodora subsp. variegata]